MHAVLIVLAATAGFLKGQLHTHSDRSGDGHTPPAEVLRWYEERGYDFVVFTDHDRITTEPGRGALLSIAGAELTQNLETCEPAPRPGQHCLLHVNALFVDGKAAVPPWAPPTSDRRLDRYTRALDATRAMQGIAQLNHPNFHFAADADLIADLGRRGLLLMEIANQSDDVNNTPRGAASTEELWDAVLSRDVLVYGTATDDAHHFYDARERAARGEAVYTGDRGFVMVRAARDAAAIRSALETGDFYASTGVLLQRLDFDRKQLVLEVAPESAPGEHVFRLIGKGGRILATKRGRAATFSMAGAGKGYVRAVVEDARGRRAWVQPKRVPQ